MRFILIFLIGLISCFYIGDLYFRITKKAYHNIPGLILTVIAIILYAIGRFFIPPPIDSLLATLLLGAGLGLLTHHLLSQQYFFNEKVEKNFVNKHPRLVERFLEILPGALTWIALTSPIWLSFTLPYAVAYLIILADIYWLINALKLGTLLYIGYRRLNFAKKQPWLELLKKDFPQDYNNYYHLVALPAYKEGVHILKPALDAIANSIYPPEKIFLALGFEDHSPQETVAEIRQYVKNYSKTIGGVFLTIHELQPGELRGPGTNRNWMINHAQKEFKKLKIDPGQVFVTTLDADFVIHEQFLAGALHKYLSTPASIRDKRSYTGCFLYYNNYWQTPAPMRLIAVGTAFWQLAEMVGSDKYMNFSSMSINLRSLLDIGLWIPDKVNDDSGFFWKAYFHFKGDYKVLPHYLPITADAVLDTNLPKTFQNQYLQLKRWAYGVEHIPFVFTKYFTSHDLDFWDKTDKLLFALWGYLRWGMLALFVTFASFFIPLVNPGYSQSTVAVNLPIISSWMLTAAFFGLFSTIFVHEKTAPPRPKNWGIVKRFWSYIQWLLLPIIMVTISTVPAIDAQTSLMFGRYMEFRTTNKARILPQ